MILPSTFRPLSYPDTDVVLMCFAIDSVDSFQNITEKWLPEVSYFCPSVPVILVGTKKDIRQDPEVLEELAKQNIEPVTVREAEVVRDYIGAHTYLECSAKTREGVEEIFLSAARASLKKRKKKQSHCCVL